MAVLLGAEQVARPPDLEVAEGELEPGAELRELLERAEASLGRLVHTAVGGHEQVGVRLLALPPDASP